MHKLFTSEDVIRYTYDEMPPDEALEFKLELNECEEIAAEFRSVKAAKNLLDNSTETASARSIQNILNYSKSITFFSTASSPKRVEVVLN